MCDERKGDGGKDRGNGRACSKFETVCSRAPGDEGGQSNSQEFKDQGQLRFERRGTKANEEKGPGTNPVPGLASDLKNAAGASRCARQVSYQTCANKGKDDYGDGHDDEAAEQGLCG